MAKRGETRPWRVRYTWSISGESTGSGTETRSTFEEARTLTCQLQRTAHGERAIEQRMRVAGTVQHRDSPAPLVTFDYGPDGDIECGEPVSPKPG